jgi:hypothetical protein
VGGTPRPWLQLESQAAALRGDLAAPATPYHPWPGSFPGRHLMVQPTLGR